MAALRIHQHGIDDMRIALPFPPLALGASRQVKRIAALEHHPFNGFGVLALHPGWVKTAIGGDQAPLDVEESVRGLVDVVEKARGSGGQAFLDYRGQTIPW